MPKRTWTDDQLRRTVAAVASYPALTAALGLDSSLEAAVRRRIKVLGIDTRHFSQRRGGGRPRRWTDAELAEAVRTSQSIAQVIRKLGLIPAGGNYD